MNADLRSRIELVRDALNQDPDGVLIGKLPPGVSPPEELRAYEDLYQFNEVTNGACCGAIQFYYSEELIRRQNSADYLDGGRNSWLLIGTSDAQTIALNRSSSKIHIVNVVYDLEYAVHERLDAYLDALFGPAYLSTVYLDQEDRWFRLLRSLGLID